MRSAIMADFKALFSFRLLANLHSFTERNKPVEFSLNVKFFIEYKYLVKFKFSLNINCFVEYVNTLVEYINRSLNG